MAGVLEGSLLGNTTARRLIAHSAHKFRTLTKSPTSQIAAVSLATATAVVLTVWFWKRMVKSSHRIMAGNSQAQNSIAMSESHDPQTTDPDLLRNHSDKKSFTTSRFTYPAVRVFYKPHARFDELPKDPAPLPLLVFVHGLGGSIAQFHPLLTSLTHNSSCLAVDLPGCGVSELSPTTWDAYTNEALVELLDVIIDAYRDKNAGQGVVLIGHSMGCSLSARLASPGASKVADHVMALIAICPPAGPPTAEQVNTFRKLLWIPTPVFDLWRSWDARGGVESASVKRFVGDDADLESKRLQNRFNRQSRTPTWRRMAWGSLPTYGNGAPKGGIAGQEVWSVLNIPVFLIGGGKDHITPAKEIERIASYLKAHVSASENVALGYHQPIVDAAAPVDTSVNIAKPVEDITEITEDDFLREKKHMTDSSEDDAQEDPITPHEASASAVGIPPQPLHPEKVVKTIVIPHGTHALVYTQDCSHVLASIIADFLSQHVTSRLSRSWQLQYLNKEGKWELKNLAKWQGVEPVSKSIAGVFRAMKTMREVDEDHSPAKFIEKWGNIVKDVIDISKDTPIYDPAGLQRAGVRYHKFPTVSKIPPTDTEVDKFIALVDRLRKEQATRAEHEHWDPDSEHAVGVHCHYGYNRTGYFIVCYLIERCGYGVQQAIDAFAKARPKGIRHSHFKDQLFVRYSGLNRQRTAQDFS